MPDTVFSSSFLLQLVSSLPFPVHIFSGGGEMLYQNDESRELRKMDALDGHLAAVHPEDRGVSFANWEKALSETAPIEHKMRYLYTGLDYRWFQERIIFIDGLRAGILIDLHVLKVQTDSIEKALKDFAHELRAPLTSMRLKAQITARKFGDKVPLQELVAKILVDMDRAEKMLQGFELFQD
jgi:signal transduction histidine kinase